MAFRTIIVRVLTATTRQERKARINCQVKPAERQRWIHTPVAFIQLDVENRSILCVKYLLWTNHTRGAVEPGACQVVPAFVVPTCRSALRRAI